MVQKHDATRLHWDLRLEIDGVYKNWAVTKGPSPDPDVKRLAVRTEDHPLSYGEFEGTIPKGEYGGGTVMLWDRGTWAPVEGKSAQDIGKGHLHFTLEGERMKGEWLLIRLKKKAGVVPLRCGHDWAVHKDFARRFAEALSVAEPDRFTATMSKAKRKGKIFIDWLRNQRGSTAVLPYSARARSGAPVAVPVAWDELHQIDNAHPFSIDDAQKLIDRAQEKVLARWGFAHQPLPDI